MIILEYPRKPLNNLDAIEDRIKINKKLRMKA